MSEHGGDPARAFEDLRAEVSVLRRAVETLPGVLEEHRPPDYSLDLGQIAKRLEALAAQVDGMQRHPALRMTPEAHQVAISHAGDSVVRDAVRKLDDAIHSTERGRQQIAEIIGTTRTRADQKQVVLWTAGSVFAVTFLAVPILIEALPFGLGSRYAARVMGTSDRWDAGAALMEAASPEGWRGMVDASRLVRANQDALTACRDAASKAKTAQHCMLSVPAP